MIFKFLCLSGFILGVLGFYCVLRTLDPATTPVTAQTAGRMMYGGLLLCIITIIPAMGTGFSK